MKDPTTTNNNRKDCILTSVIMESSLFFVFENLTAHPLPPYSPIRPHPTTPAPWQLLKTSCTTSVASPRKQ